LILAMLKTINKLFGFGLQAGAQISFYPRRFKWFGGLCHALYASAAQYAVA